MLLFELIKDLPITVARGDPKQLRIGDVTEDSRTALPGSLFIARPGQTSDGRAFAQNAVDAGATAILTQSGTDPASLPPGAAVLTTDHVRTMTAILAERLCGNPSRRLLLVGVTGTNGKSTVTHLVHQLLNRSGVRCGMIGTVQVDDGTEIAPSTMTTPPAPELSRTLATMVEAGCDAAVMEVSSHAIDQHRTAGLSFDAGVFTNISGEHLDYHGTLGSYLETKRGLFRQLDTGDGNGLAILNADDPNVAQTPAKHPVFCSIEAAHAKGWHTTRTGTSVDGEQLTLRHGPVAIDAHVPLFGAFNAMNITQAVAASWAVLARTAVDEADRTRMLRDALSLVCAPPGRLEPVHQPGDDTRVFVDYAHTDDALERVLASLRAVMPEQGRARLWCVFGCGGNRDRTKRPRMGRAAVRGADRVVLTSDNPRTEPIQRIIADVLGGLTATERDTVAVHIDRTSAVHAAIAGAEPGDVVLLAGKGHETAQMLPDGKGGVRAEPFDDRAVAREALADRRAARTGGVIA